MESKTPLVKVIEEIVEKYLEAVNCDDWQNRSYEMGRAHGALLLAANLNSATDEGRELWNKAFDSVQRKYAKLAQEVGVG